MLQFRAMAVVAALALTVPGAEVPAVAQDRHDVACTATGCQPIPPNCRPKTGYRWNGMPRGYDAVVCR